MKNQGLVIGRFQLVGNQHVDLFNQILEYHINEQKLDSLNVGIGVADRVDKKNPFSATECWNMIKPVAEDIAKKMDIPLYHRLIDDINDPPNYAGHVSTTFGFGSQEDKITIFSGNIYTTDCFRKKPEYQVVKTKERIGQHSTELRKLYANGADITSLVPNHIPDYLDKRNTKSRLEKLSYDNPIPTVDLVIKYNGGIVVIERNEEPFGYALPGGHVDYGESVEAAAIREAKEETGLDVKLEKLIGVFSDPERDPRGHRISIAYSAIGSGEIKAGSDAKKVQIYKNIPDNLVFDHKEILNKYFRNK